MSGYIEFEWLPQTAICLMLATGLPVLAESWESERLWSRRSIAEKHLGESEGADFMVIQALVLQGLPTTSTLTSRLATASSALPWTVKISPLALSSSERSMPLVRGRAPTRNAACASLKATIGSLEAIMSARSGKALSASSIITPLRRFMLSGVSRSSI